MTFTLGHQRAIKHGDTAGGRIAVEHKCWASMKARCLNPSALNFKHYGGRGITVCDEWVDDYEAFLAHVGRRPSSQHSLDRVDNERGYEPGNVRWATKTEQARNRRPRRDPNTAWAESIIRSAIHPAMKAR
jgi:hypothetical protein